MTKKHHHCSLALGSDSMLPKRNRWLYPCRALWRLCLASEHHPLAFEVFRSYSTVVAERQRQYSEGDTCIIHPLSLFSLSWKSLMAVVNVLHMIISSFRLTYVLEPSPYQLCLRDIDHIILVLHIICMVDIVLNFHFGFKEGLNHISLDRTRVMSRYARRWFIFDVVSCAPIAYILLLHNINEPRYVYIAHILPIVRTLHICDVISSIAVFMRLFFSQYVSKMISNIVLLVLSVHWCACLVYLSAVNSYYWTGKFPKLYASFLNIQVGKNLTEYTLNYRYNKGMFMSLSSFFGSGFSLYTRYDPLEYVVHSLIILYASLFMVYCLVFLIRTYITHYNYLIRYHELIDQVKEYMRHKQFPTELQKRVIDFYYYAYQSTYFREDVVLDTLSEQLRNEIALYTCHKLVYKVRVFAGLPPNVVGAVLGCLHPEVYLANDLIVRAGDIGDCMYFIANGTVAVYSLKGVEICHMHDGAHFGEVALLMKDRKRVATVVAVEITQVYRLDAADFRHFVMSNQVLYQRIETLASQRMHETVLLDDAFRHERERLNELKNAVVNPTLDQYTQPTHQT